MSANADPRRHVDERYYYQRPLGVRELLPVIGIGISVGALAFYVARVLAARTPLRMEPDQAVELQVERSRKRRSRRGPG